jgi:hypothetical protein
MSVDFKQIEIESKIIYTLNRDNAKSNTFHFVWYQDSQKFNLEIVSCNPQNLQIFLLLSQSGYSLLNCLELALERIVLEKSTEYSWTVTWIDEDNKEHISYFLGKNEYEVRNKFYYTGLNTSIINIKKMPIS